MWCIVVCYVRAGNGETDDGLHSIFRAAWEAHPDRPVALFGSGQNIIPAIHVTDLAAYVAAVCIEPPEQQYLLAVDDAQLSHRELVSAIAAKMGSTPVRENTLQDLYFQQASLLQSHNWTLSWCGMHAHLGKSCMLRVVSCASSWASSCNHRYDQKATCVQEFFCTHHKRQSHVLLPGSGPG